MPVCSSRAAMRRAAACLLLLLPPSLGMLEDLKAGLGGAKAYLDGLLPMLAEGIKAVQVGYITV